MGRVRKHDRQSLFHAAGHRSPPPPASVVMCFTAHGAYRNRTTDSSVSKQERALQEWDSKREYDQGREYWLLVLQAEDGRLIAASVVDASWFSINTMSSNLRDHNPTFIFGTLEKWVEEIPLISPIVIMLESPVR